MVFSWAAAAAAAKLVLWTKKIVKLDFGLYSQGNYLVVSISSTNNMKQVILVVWISETKLDDFYHSGFSDLSS